MGDWEELEREFGESACGALFPGTKIVYGRGGVNPKVMFIGEAPGAEEDKVGLPFVGRSGKLLDEWIGFLDLHEDEYYISSVLKNRPPENRNPTREEVRLCAPWLDKQIELLDPDYIVCLGRFAMQHFFPKQTAVLKNSGKLLDKRYFVIPHPSYFIRRGGTGWQPYLEKLKELL